jgi:hypothetical protein
LGGDTGPFDFDQRAEDRRHEQVADDRKYDARNDREKRGIAKNTADFFVVFLGKPTTHEGLCAHADRTQRTAEKPQNDEGREKCRLRVR